MKISQIIGAYLCPAKEIKPQNVVIIASLFLFLLNMNWVLGSKIPNLATSIN